MEEIADLLLNPMFEIPGESSTCNSPYSMAKKEGTLQSRKGIPGLPEATTSLPTWSSRVDTADVMAHSSNSLSHSTLERDTSHTPYPLLANSINLSDDVLHLQEEMNDTMVHLLSSRAAIDMCQNEIDTSKTIRGIKAWYTAAIGDADAAYGTALRKAEAVWLASTSKVEVIQATGIRKAKAANAVWAS